MQKAKITAVDGYKCAPDGHEVVTFPFGKIVTGKVAKWALADKAASAMFGKKLETKVDKPKRGRK